MINPDALRFEMWKKDMTITALADKTGLSPKTISRILVRKFHPNADTARKIADAFRVSPAALATPPDDLRRAKAEVKRAKQGLHRISADLAGRAALNFDLVEKRYGIPVDVQIEAAPLFATILAEMSLADRRKRLAESKAAFAAALDVMPKHLDCYRTEDPFDEACRAEEDSLKKSDVSGVRIEGRFRDETGDLFIASLQRLVTKFKNEAVTEISGSADGPDTDLFDGLFESISGGDEWAKFALLNRHVRLRDIPEGLDGPDRAAWLAAQVPGVARAEYLKSLAALDQIVADFSSGKIKLTPTSGKIKFTPTEEEIEEVVRIVRSGFTDERE